MCYTALYQNEWLQAYFYAKCSFVTFALVFFCAIAFFLLRLTKVNCQNLYKQYWPFANGNLFYDQCVVKPWHSLLKRFIFVICVFNCKKSGRDWLCFLHSIQNAHTTILSLKSTKVILEWHIHCNLWEFKAYFALQFVDKLLVLVTSSVV